ncbi:sulfatase-like hydrolase/transferase [Larkinella soli]|uniref:sulfatase-like hydrolase/transferase n=1 Tax=Larkinella soli TaxID=1770527 RepID=UPI000FFBC5FD|nr:sulfatase-like hydrolase/transferase [Larkinella soli]
MNRPITLILVLLLLFGLTDCRKPSAGRKASAGKPNIIFILTDDLGYGDLGILFQNERAAAHLPFHRTPHLDQMAREGIRLTRHYVPAPVCAPSRASLMLGRHQGHANVRNNQFDKALADEPTLASVLKEAGYATGLVGKWGLQGTEGKTPETWEAYPTKRGFDYFLGYVRHVDGHNHYPAHKAAMRPPMELYEDHTEISRKLKGVYTTDLFTAAAKRWITDQHQARPEQPFFLYLAYDTPHAGLQVASSPYPAGGGLKGGVQWKGEAGRFVNTVTDTIDTYLHPDYAARNWPDHQKRFASMVRRIDDAVGDLMLLLRDLNIDDNTLVVFTSDNGPHRESYGYGEYEPSFFDSYGAMDGIKRDVWEGGIRVPTLVRWPGGIPAGRESDTPGGFHDWLPTFARLAGIPAPATTDGVSLLPTLTGRGTQPPGTVYIEYQVNGQTPEYEEFEPSHRRQAHGEMQVIYLDGYKGIRTDIQSADDNFRIYDTRTDPKERNDLAGTGAAFTALQKRMKQRVLQVRRPDADAPRPYDRTPIPALETASASASAGLRYRVFEVGTPWTPAVEALTQPPVKTGVSPGVDLGVRTRDHDIVIEYGGLIDVPETGEYTFTLQTDRGAVLRLHDACVLHTGKNYAPGSAVSGRVLLAKGRHPIRLVYARGSSGMPGLRLEWSGPGFSARALPPDRLVPAP